MKIRILDLKPTQFALGLREVARKVSKLKSMGHDERHEYLHARPIPVVLSARKHWHLVDHHHHARACWEIGVEELPVEVKADLSHLALGQFWDAMHEARWIHLLDQFGRGPHEPHLLPEDIRGLADDPYRSLAWALRHAGAYEKSDAAFSEFRWADFLRKELVVEPGDEGFKAALETARGIARSPKAAHLPGFLGRKA
ncbi:MAG: ParB-like protein [Elusimicrobiota bacterium]